MKRILFCFVLLCVSVLSFAQFSDSGVLYYVYDYTDTDGIRSAKYEPMSNYNGSGVVVIFKNGIVEVYSTSMRKIAEGADDAVNSLKSQLSKKLQLMAKTQPTSLTDGVFISKYYPDLSTSSKTTYRSYYREVSSYVTKPDLYSMTLPREVFSYKPWVWKDLCYTFSNDQSQMIKWNYDNTTERVYYKRVTPEEMRQSVKKNLDFLYE